MSGNEINGMNCASEGSLIKVDPDLWVNRSPKIGRLAMLRPGVRDVTDITEAPSAISASRLEGFTNAAALLTYYIFDPKITGSLRRFLKLHTDR